MKVDMNLKDDAILENDTSYLFKLSLCTQAGTYVKEFVHGDFGRTSPSLCSIIECDVDIIALDVEVILKTSYFQFESELLFAGKMIFD